MSTIPSEAKFNGWMDARVKTKYKAHVLAQRGVPVVGEVTGLDENANVWVTPASEDPSQAPLDLGFETPDEMRNEINGLIKEKLTGADGDAVLDGDLNPPDYGTIREIAHLRFREVLETTLLTCIGDALDESVTRTTPPGNHFATDGAVSNFIVELVASIESKLPNLGEWQLDDFHNEFKNAETVGDICDILLAIADGKMEA